MPSIPSQKNSDGKVLPGYPADEPERLESRLGEQLRHLGMVAECVDEPAGRDVNPELVAIVTLAVLHLANERLPAGHVVIGHDVERTRRVATVLPSGTGGNRPPSPDSARETAGHRPPGRA